MKYTYTAVITPAEDGTEFYCRVPDLPGCITTGADIDDCIDLISDAMALWLVSAEDHGDPIPPASKQSDIEREDDSVLSIIRADTIAYRALTDTRSAANIC